MDEAGFEPSVPPQEGTGSPAALIEERLSACVANCEKDGGTTSSNPLSSSGESGELRGFEIRKTHIGNGGFQSFLLLAGCGKNQVAERCVGFQREMLA